MSDCLTEASRVERRIAWPGRWILLAATLVILTTARGQDLETEEAAPESATGVDRKDPAAWLLWRHGPIPFPTWVSSAVPEWLKDGPVIDFGKYGKDLVIVTPDVIPAGHDGGALKAMIGLIAKKVPNALVVTASALTPAQRGRQLLIVGTPRDNTAANAVLGDKAGEFLAGIPAGGYRLKAVENPFAPGKRAIVILGADLSGAWAGAAVLAFSIHPKQKGLSPIKDWPVAIADGTYWAPFEARYDGNRTPKETAPPSPVPAPPVVPYGVRVWGSPTPDLESYQRTVEALKGLGANTVVVQPGGWPDQENCGPFFRKAVDIAWSEGIYTILYVGNEMVGHRPAPLTDGHRDVVRATKDHPGLLSWHLYNQLAAKLTPEERDEVEKQMRWLRSESPKPIAVEVVWGHNQAKMPDDKAALVRDLKSWGMDEVASDLAPIGGWSHGDISLWEPRMAAYRDFHLPPQAVLQAHVPFLEPRVPRDVEMRNEYWWALAGGARAFFWECATLYTHINVRGLLSWDLKPLPDGRCDEVRRLAEVTKRLEAVIARGEPADAEIATLGLEAKATTVKQPALRLRQTPDGVRYLLLINPSVEKAMPVTVTRSVGAVLLARELVTDAPPQEFTNVSPLVVELPPGGGACFQLGDTAQAKR